MAWFSNKHLYEMQEEFRALMLMLATGEGNSFPGSFKGMLAFVDK